MIRRPLALLGAAALVAALAACAPGSPVDDGRLRIVASTNVYGDIAATIAGDAAVVTSIISSPAQDPHSYEASARDRLAVADADLVVRNGGGYDSFVDSLIDASGTDAVVLDAVAIAGLTPDVTEGDDDHTDDPHDEDHPADEHDGHDHLDGVDEHVWYSLDAMEVFARELAGHLAELDPGNADVFAANLAEFTAGVAVLEERVHALHERLEGTGIALTEPVPASLLADLGLDNLTPAAFTEAIEEGADVPPLALDETLRLIGDGRVAMLAYNAQTASSETERVRRAAEEAGIPVVDFTETLPDGADYVSWMTGNVEAVAAALS